jgi:hypothetical protein
MVGGAAMLLAIAALVASTGARAAGYVDGAPLGFSGGFGEESCHACHFSAEPNSGDGRVTIIGLPRRFAAGQRYTVTVTLTRAGMKRAGFQLTARFQKDGAAAGTLAPAPGEEARIGVDVQGDLRYANQRKEGATLTSPDAATWSLVWTAPADRGPVVFQVAANAANGDETTDGDHIHTAAVEVLP